MATFTLFLATLVGQIDADKRQLLQYISTASKTNADLSAHGRVEFRVLRKSDAGSGDVNDLPADAVERANGLFIFDARNAFLSLSYSDNELTSGYKEIDKNKHTMTTVPTTLLTDGKSTLLNVLDYSRTPVTVFFGGSLISFIRSLATISSRTRWSRIFETF
jgi:hypothetical protein